MYSPVMMLRSFESIPHAGKVAILHALVETLIVANIEYLRSHPDTPPLYSQACLSNPNIVFRQRNCQHYEFEPPHTDNWQDIAECMALGHGDCEDLAAWRIAELRVQGEPAQVRIVHSNYADHTLYHIQVLRGDSSVEDPSVLLGMPPPTHPMAE